MRNGVTAVTADGRPLVTVPSMKQGDNVTLSQWLFTVAGVVMIVLALVLSAHGA